MDRKTIFNTEARNGLKEGIDELANAVKVTLGPKGRIVMFHNRYTGIHATKDGVTVAEEIKPDTNIKKMGAEIIKQAASKTAKLAGDGTTTSTVIAQALITAGLRNVASGANPVDIKRGMDKAMKQIVENLNDISQEIGNNIDKIKNVAAISANNDELIGNLIAKAYDKIGIDGTITIEEAKGMDTYVDVVQGIQFNKGYLSPYLVTDTDAMQVIYDNIHIVLYAGKISEIQEVDAVLKYSQNQATLLICYNMTSEVLASVAMAKLKGKNKIVVVKAPYVGVKRDDYLEDIAILTGGYVISKDKGYSLSSFSANMAGSAEKCVINKTDTIIINGNGKQESIQNHIETLTKSQSKLSAIQEVNMMKERISVLGGGVAVLYIGAASEVEMKEKKDRADDALQATKAAIEEGIVAGGGVALVRASLGDMIECTNFDEINGVNIVINACKAPLFQIANNSGQSGEVIINEILSNDSEFYGYDFKNDEYCNMIDSGIIDPKKVTRVALENAVSVAGIVIMTECALVNKGNQEEGLPDFLLDN